MRARRAITLALLVATLASAARGEIVRSPIPVLRPAGDIGRETPKPPQAEWQPSAPAVKHSPLPQARPEDFAERAQAALAKSKVSYGHKGSVCGNAAIRGQASTAIPGRIKGCGVEAPVRVTEIAGLKFSSPATMDCTTAKALHTWIEESAKPAVRPLGEAAGLHVMASYACRTRNNQKGAKISEHGRGRAIDIGGVRLTNGNTISVLKDWGKGAKGTALRTMHRGACGPFGTVLGPDADRFHRDHFHFDTAQYRSRSYCR
ncbi:extensin family protein [Celeribacter sp.]|uniref:extensin-like domain-containing protein n=1 Tax=Celeribacter sp. TaxID=1890673 RepID=UPI003A902BEC